MKKVLCLIIAVAMISTLAISASATWTLDIVGDGGTKEIQVSGGNPLVPNAICFTLIKGARITLDLPDFHCGPDEDDEDGEECNKECVTTFVFSGPFNKDDKFCYAEKQSMEYDFGSDAWVDGEDGAQGSGIDWLKLAAASWVEDNDGTAKIEILGAGGVVLAQGTGCDSDECDKSVNCGSDGDDSSDDDTTEANSNNNNNNNNNTGTSNNQKVDSNAKGPSGGGKVDTGVAGIALIGGIAVVAAGAIVISKKRK